jgi:hypothetical protein
MFEFLKQLFSKREQTSSADIDPFAAAALTTDTSSDEPVQDESDKWDEDTMTSDTDFDGGSDFDID